MYKVKYVTAEPLMLIKDLKKANWRNLTGNGLKTIYTNMFNTYLSHRIIDSFPLILK